MDKLEMVNKELDLNVLPPKNLYSAGETGSFNSVRVMKAKLPNDMVSFGARNPGLKNNKNFTLMRNSKRLKNGGEPFVKGSLNIPSNY